MAVTVFPRTRQTDSRFVFRGTGSRFLLARHPWGLAASPRWRSFCQTRPHLTTLDPNQVHRTGTQLREIPLPSLNRQVFPVVPFERPRDVIRRATTSPIAQIAPTPGTRVTRIIGGTKIDGCSAGGCWHHAPLSDNRAAVRRICLAENAVRAPGARQG